MALPPNVAVFAQAMDPTDLVDFRLELSRGTGATDVLNNGEGIASYTLTLTAEAVALGLTIETSGGYAMSTPDDRTIVFWLSVATGQRTNALFDGAGVTLGLELTINTTAVPPRRRQKTVAVKVAQQ